MHKGKATSVYFIRCGRYVKIGISTAVGKRLSALQSSNPLEVVLLRVEPGGREREEQLHRIFQEHHHRGEWFLYQGSLAQYLSMFRRPRGMRTRAEPRGMPAHRDIRDGEVGWGHWLKKKR